MRITLKVHLNIEGCSSQRGGEFNVRKEEDIPKLTHDWIRSIMMETGYRKTGIKKSGLERKKRYYG